VPVSIGEHDRQPSKYRLTMFECDGIAPDHLYVRKAQHHRNQRMRKGEKPALVRDQLGALIEQQKALVAEVRALREIPGSTERVDRAETRSLAEH
jgi:hypothetical protein